VDRLSWNIAVMVSAAILSLPACAGVPAAPATPSGGATATNSPTPTATAALSDPATPTGAVMAAFEAAKAGGTPRQIEFLACVSGGSSTSMFIGLFGARSEQALAASGFDPDEYFSAFSASFDDFKVAETSRSRDRAAVHLNVAVTLSADVDKLRDLMRQHAAARGMLVDDPAIDVALSSLMGQLPRTRSLDQGVNVVQNERPVARLWAAT
jgi:hypothetical protein